MAYYLFDNPRVGITLAIIAEAVVFLTWALLPGRLKARYLLIAPMVVAVFLALDWLIETDREQLESSARLIVQAVEDENAEAVISMMSANFSIANSFEKDAAAAIIRLHLRKPVIAANHIRELKVTDVSQSGGRVVFRAITTMDPKGHLALARVVTSQWQFDYERGISHNDRYKLSSITMLKFNGGKAIDVWKSRW